MFRLVKSISTPNVQALGEDSQILERIRSEMILTMVTQGAGIGQLYNSDKIIFHDGDHHYDNNDV